jgi:hypothetical protein
MDGESRFKGIGERAGEGMAEALLIKDEEAFSCDPQMASRFPGRLEFRGRINLRRGQVAAINQIMDGTSGDGEELGNIADFDEGWNGLFVWHGTICNHGVEFSDILTSL